jgi:hypothetical protein
LRSLRRRKSIPKKSVKRKKKLLAALEEEAMGAVGVSRRKDRLSHKKTLRAGDLGKNRR